MERSKPWILQNTKRKTELSYTDQACILELINLQERKLELQLQPKTKTGVKIKAKRGHYAFASNGYTVKDKPTITTYKELVKVWWDSYKNTVKPNTRQSMDGFG